jgi:hypothetical protein
MLVGLHLNRSDVEPVEHVVPVDVEGLTVSAVRYSSESGKADPALLRQVLRAREDLLRRATFIAIRYGNSVRHARDAAALVRPRLQSWRHILEASQGLVEMTLRAASGEKPSRPDRRDFSSGAAYLRSLQSLRKSSAVSAEFLGDAERRLAPHSVDYRVLQREDGSAEIALLVRRSGIDALTAVSAELRKLYPEQPFLLSGPWPLETFADAEQ